jgi:hypothetical protein
MHLHRGSVGNGLCAVPLGELCGYVVWRFRNATEGVPYRGCSADTFVLLSSLFRSARKPAS